MIKDNTFISKVDDFGRIRIPKEIRKAMSLKEYTNVILYIEDSKIIIIPNRDTEE